MPRFFSDYNPDIPDELLINIFSYLDNRTLTLTVPLVSKNWLSIVNAKSFRKNSLFCILKRTGLRNFNELHDKAELITSGYTNENYKITLGDQCYILRIPIMKDHIFIDRYYEEFNTNIAHKLNLGAEVVYYEHPTGIMLTRYIINQNTLTRELLADKTILLQITHVLKRLHGSDKEFLGNWFIFNRIKNLHDFLINYYLPINREILEEIFDKITLAETLFDKLVIPFYPCHNDLSPNNFLLTNEGIKIIDWEFSGNNDRIWDLAFLSVVSELDVEFENYLLDLYFDNNIDEFDFCRFVIYKPIVHFWIGLLSLLQIYNCNSKLGKYWLTQIASDKFNAAGNAFSQIAYQNAFNKLHSFMETNNRDYLTIKY